jgi:hypothetical protein
MGTTSLKPPAGARGMNQETEDGNLPFYGGSEPSRPWHQDAPTGSEVSRSSRVKPRGNQVITPNRLRERGSLKGVV